MRACQKITSLLDPFLSLHIRKREISFDILHRAGGPKPTFFVKAFRSVLYTCGTRRGRQQRPQRNKCSSKRTSAMEATSASSAIQRSRGQQRLNPLRSLWKTYDWAPPRAAPELAELTKRQESVSTSPRPSQFLAPLQRTLINLCRRLPCLRLDTLIQSALPVPFAPSLPSPP